MDWDDLLKWFTYAEDAVYLATGALLGVTGAVLLVSTGGTFVDAVREGTLAQRSFEMLDSLLLVLIMVELVRTIRVSLLERTLAAEPFLVVALIVGVRRILLLTAETSFVMQQRPEDFELFLVEIGVFTVFILAVVGSLVLLRRSGAAGGGDPAAGREDKGGDGARGRTDRAGNGT